MISQWPVVVVSCSGATPGDSRGPAPAGPEFGDRLPSILQTAFNVDDDTILATRLQVTDATSPGAGPLERRQGTPSQRGARLVEPNGASPFTPSPDTNGPDDYVAIANSGFRDALPGLVSIDVRAANGRPVIVRVVPEAVTTVQGERVNGAVMVLDAEGDWLTVSIVNEPTHGTAAVSPVTGRFAYTPEPGFVGLDTFQVVVNDGFADSAPVEVEVSVTAS